VCGYDSSPSSISALDVRRKNGGDPANPQHSWRKGGQKIGTGRLNQKGRVSPPAVEGFEAQSHGGTNHRKTREFERPAAVREGEVDDWRPSFHEKTRSSKGGAGRVNSVFGKKGRPVRFAKRQDGRIPCLGQIEYRKEKGGGNSQVKW